MYRVKYIDEEQWTDRCAQQYYVILNSKGYRIGQPFGDWGTAEAACRALNAAGDPDDRPRTQPPEKIRELALVCRKRRALCSNPDGTLKVEVRARVHVTLNPAMAALEDWDDACQRLIRAILQD
jgi:hypothetical protein